MEPKNSSRSRKNWLQKLLERPERKLRRKFYVLDKERIAYASDGLYSIMNLDGFAYDDKFMQSYAIGVNSGQGFAGGGLDIRWRVHMHHVLMVTMLNAG